MAPLDRCSLLL